MSEEAADPAPVTGVTDIEEWDEQPPVVALCPECGDVHAIGDRMLPEKTRSQCPACNHERFRVVRIETLREELNTNDSDT